MRVLTNVTYDFSAPAWLEKARKHRTRVCTGRACKSEVSTPIVGAGACRGLRGSQELQQRLMLGVRTTTTTTMTSGWQRRTAASQRRHLGWRQQRHLERRHLGLRRLPRRPRHRHRRPGRAARSASRPCLPQPHPPRACPMRGRLLLLLRGRLLLLPCRRLLPPRPAEARRGLFPPRPRPRRLRRLRRRLPPRRR